MTTYTIDTHETVRQFVAAGIPDKQAEAIVAAISRTDAELATKADLKQEIATVKADFKQEIATVKADLTAAVAELKVDMLKVAIGVAVGIVIANASLTVALIRLFSVES